MNLVIGTLSAGGTLGGPSNASQCNSAGFCLGNSAGSGNFTVNPDPTGSITLGNVNFVLDGGLNIAGGSTAGNVSVGGINADGNVSIQAAGDVSLQGYVADAGSDFSVNAGRDILVNDDMGSSEGNYRAATNFNAGRHIVINKDIYSGNNDINLNADTDGDNIGDVAINASTSGRHTILTGGDLNVSGQNFNVNGADFGTVGTLTDQRAQVSVRADRIIVNINGDMTLQAGRIDLDANLGTSGAGGTNASVDTSVTVSATRLVDITANNLSVRGGTAAASVSGTSYTSSVRALANAELVATGGNMNVNLTGSLDLQAGVAIASLFDRGSSDIAVAEANASIKASGAIDIVAATGVAVNAGSVLANAQGIVNGGSPVKARANATIDAGANLDLAVANGNLQIVGGTATAGATGTGGGNQAADASARAQINAGNNTRISITNGNLSVQAGTATASLSGSIADGDAGADADAVISADKNITADVSNMITVTGGTALVSGDWTSATTMSAEADANATIDAGADLTLNVVGGLNVNGGGASATPSTSSVTTGSPRGLPAARPTNGAASAFAIGGLKAGGKAVVNVSSGSLALTGGSANPTSGSISTGSGALTVFMTYAHASVKANTLKMMANTDITASNAKINAKGVYLGAGNNINLVNTLTTVGKGAAPGVKGDPLLFNVMNAAGIGLPNNSSPNLFMHAGNSMFTGDVRSTASNSYLWFKANFLSTGSYTMPSGPSLVQLSPHTGMYTIGLEDISPSAQMVNYTNSQHISDHPMTTIAIGSAQQTGKIRVGANGPIDIGSKNIILLTTPDDVRDLSRIMTTGIVATSGFVASVDGEPAVFVTPRLDSILVDLVDEEEEVKRRKRRKVEKTDNDHNMCVAL